jgi:Stage II sporulation protein E (SpoIIE)
MFIPQCPSFIHVHSYSQAGEQPAQHEKPENILIARLATDLLVWIDSAWIVGLIRAVDTAAVDVIGVFNESGDPAQWAGYVESIARCARAETTAVLDSLLRGQNLVRILFPIETDGQVVAILAVGPRNGNAAQPYTASDIAVMRDLCGQIGGLLRAHAAKIDSHDGNAENAELDTARGIQDRLLPACPPCVSGIECCGQCERTGRLGGDFFEFSGSTSTGLMAAIGNVATEGSPGCILMTGLQACLRSLGRRGVQLPDLFGEMNRMFWEIAPENTYATLFSVRIDPGRERLHYVNAGHRTSLVVRRGGRIDRLEPNAAVLGLRRGSAYLQRTIPFRPGDTLIALSDGITEPAGDAALIEMVEDCGGSLRQLPTRLMDLMDPSPRPRILDRTVVVAHFRRESPAGAHVSHPAAA